MADESQADDIEITLDITASDPDGNELDLDTTVLTIPLPPPDDSGPADERYGRQIPEGMALGGIIYLYRRSDLDAI